MKTLPWVGITTGSESTLRCVGLQSVLNNLPNKTKTYITRQFDSNGIELSGGESQKIAIARAIYKNTPVLIFETNPQHRLIASKLKRKYIIISLNYRRIRQLYLSHIDWPHQL